MMMMLKHAAIIQGLCLLLLVQVSALTNITVVNGKANGFYHAEGTRIIDPQGNPYIAKGFVASNWWLPEAYALDLDEVHDRYLDSPQSMNDNIVRLLNGDKAGMKEFWQMYQDNFLTKDDLTNMANLGFTSLRLPFNYRMLSPQEEPGVYLEEGFEAIDKVIGWCKDLNMSILLDMHACPGGANHEPHGDPEWSFWRDLNGVWDEKGIAMLHENRVEYTNATGRNSTFNAQRTADIWRVIADRYKDESAIVGYELINEPYYFEQSGNTAEQLREIFIRIVSQIREVDTNHICFVSGNIFSEMLDGLLPPFDDNMGVGFHRYWRETGFEDGKVQEYLDAREEHQVPFLMTESGENSNPWIYEIKELMTGLDIGWYFWGWKKVDKTAQVYKIGKSEDYQYVIDNWRDIDDVDPARVWQGLMDLTEAVKTKNCIVAPGFLEAIFDPMFNIQSKPYDPENIPMLPGVVQAVHYDVGNQGVAYSDTRYKNEEYEGTGWNLGWAYRSDGVDIQKSQDTTEPLNIGYKVFDIDAGEWMKYTVHVNQTGCFRASFRVKAGSESKLQLLTLTEEIDIPNTDWQWTTVEHQQEFPLEQGLQTVVLKFLQSGVEMHWMLFEEANCTMETYPGGFNVPGPRGAYDETTSGAIAVSRNTEESGSTDEFVSGSTLSSSMGSAPLRLSLILSMGFAWYL